MSMDLIESYCRKDNKIHTGIIRLSESSDNELCFQGDEGHSDEKFIQIKNHKSVFYICGRVALGVLTFGISEYVFGYYIVKIK